MTELERIDTRAVAAKESGSSILTNPIHTRAELALRLEPLVRGQAKENLKTSTGGKNPQPLQNSAKAADKIDTRKELAKVAGVSHDTIMKGKLVAEHANDETKHLLRTNKISIHRVAKDIKDTMQRDARQAKRTEAARLAGEEGRKAIACRTH